MADCYEILGVSPQASREEIQRAYRDLVMCYHPDRNPQNPHAAERFKQIEEAYEILENPDRSRALGAFHTAWSLFLTTRVFSKSPRRENIFVDNNPLPSLMGLATLFYLGLVVGILLLSFYGYDSRTSLPQGNGDDSIPNLLRGIPLFDYLSSRNHIIVIVFVVVTVLYLGALLFLYISSSRLRR